MKDLTFIETEIKMPLMTLPVRTVVVEINGNQIMISPGSRLTDSDFSRLKNVTDIIAPSVFHTGGVPNAVKYNTQARVWCPEGKSYFKKDLIKWTHELSSTQWIYGEELVLYPILGIPKISEVVFFHKSSQSLIVSDLFFNITQPKGFGAWFILNMFGTYKKFAMSKFFLKYVTDKDAFKKSVEGLLAFDFKNIIVSHGDLICMDSPENAKTFLKKTVLTK